MAELCTAFKRIVPRYQFATNQAAFVIEDMRDGPNRQSDGSTQYNKNHKNNAGLTGFGVPVCAHDTRFDRYATGKQHRHASSYGVNVRPRVCSPYCTKMDTCSSIKPTTGYFYDL